jgi:hypothetical protein
VPIGRCRFQSISSPSSTASTWVTSPSIRRSRPTTPEPPSTPWLSPTRGRCRSPVDPPTSHSSFRSLGGTWRVCTRGVPTDRERFGLGDPRLTFGVNLYGAQAMTRQERASWRMRTLVGASLTVAPPLGQYDDTQSHQPGLQSVVGETGDRRVASGRQMDRRSDGWRLAVHGQH